MEVLLSEQMRTEINIHRVIIICSRSLSISKSSSRNRNSTINLYLLKPCEHYRQCKRQQILKRHDIPFRRIV